MEESLTLEIFIPQQTQYARETLVSGEYLTQWNRLQRQIYRLSDGNRDLMRIASLLHKPLEEIADVTNQLVQSGFLTVQQQSIDYNQFRIDTKLLMRNLQALRPAQELFIQRFFENFFQIAPHTRRVFAYVDKQRMESSLMMMLITIVDALDSGEDVVPMLRWLGKRHAAYGIEDTYFQMAGDALIRTLREFLRWDFTTEAEASWRQVYELVTRELLSVMRNPQ